MTDLDPATAPVKPPVLDKGEQATEPATKMGFAGGGGAAVLALLVAFYVPVTPGQQAAIIGAIAALAPLVTALVIRGKVWSPESVRLLLEWARPVPDDLDGAR